MDQQLRLSKEQEERLQNWLNSTGELFVDVHRHHSGGSAWNYFVRSMQTLRSLLSEEKWPEVTITIFRRLQFPIRGVADDALLERAFCEIPEGKWIHVVLPARCYPEEYFCCAGDDNRAELRKEFKEVLGELVGIGEHPFDSETSWFENNPDEVVTVKRHHPIKYEIAVKLTSLASAGLQNQYMVNGTKAEYLVAEDILNEAYDCARLARDLPLESSGLGSPERSALFELESLLDAIPVEESTTHAELIQTPVWRQAMNKSSDIIKFLGFDLRELEKRI